jgi:hypothetical protein
MLIAVLRLGHYFERDAMCASSEIGVSPMNRFQWWGALWVVGLALLLGGMAPTVGGEIKVVSPNAMEFEEGDTSINQYAGYPPMRYQQVCPASDFQSLPESHRWITGYTSRRPDVTVEDDFSETWGHAQIILSITNAGPGDISNNFEDNIQSEPTVVYDGPITLETPNAGPADGPRNFGPAIQLQTPFEYDPSQGNLLLDVISDTGITETSGIATIDAFSSPVLAVYAFSADATWGSPCGGIPLQFTFAPGPHLQAGDADQDLDFDQLDLVKVQIAAKYLTGEPATWGEGDWDGAPGGYSGNPPPGNGFFDQLDIVAALDSDLYMAGPYPAIEPNGQQVDVRASVVYNAATGELAVDAPVQAELTSINIDSASGIFTGQPAANLGGSFDNDSDTNVFKATFGTSFGGLSFGHVAQAGLSESFLLGDLTVIGSLAGGGGLGEVDLVYIPIPEPSTILLTCLGLVAFFVHGWNGRRS